MRSYGPKLWLAIAVWVAGAIPLGYMGYANMRDLLAPLHRLDAPGSVRERLDEGEQRAILVQTAGGSGAHLAGDGVDGSDLGCSVRGDDGARVEVRSIGAYTVSRNADGYRAELAFTAPRSGRYSIACEPRRPLSLAVSRRIYIGWLFGLGFAALALCAGTIMLGVRIARRARRPTPP